MLRRPPMMPVSRMAKRVGAVLAALLLVIALPAALAEVTTPTDLETPLPTVTPDPGPTNAPPTEATPTDAPPPEGGGRPAGGRPSGSRPSGGGPGGASSEEEAGFRVTPGQALTKTHASGSGDMTAYGALALTLDSEPMTQLSLGGQALAIDCGGTAFTASLEDTTLTLTAESVAEWHLTLAALGTLRLSGIEQLRLQENGWFTDLDTALTLTGSAYARLRAQGFVSADFLLRVTAEGIAVDAAGETYRLNQSRLESEEDRS